MMMPEQREKEDHGLESPLSLVVGAHGGAVKNHGSSPGRSSGFSEGSEDHYHRGHHLVSEEDHPLSLVVREIGESESSGDSGQEEDHPRHLCPEEPDVTIAKVGSGPEKSGIKIKDFAKLLCEKECASDGTSELSEAGAWSAQGKEPFPCEFCDKVFINKYHLQSHHVTHTGERSFECRKCRKTFGRKSTLRAHMTTHTKVSNFMCPICDKACNDNNSLEEHIRMHTGEKPFVCSICSKSYARKSHLNVHYRVHTGERPFVCLNCRKDFTEKRFLNDHIQTAHSGQDGPLKCPNCFREFAYKTSLKQHLKKQMCVKNLNRTGQLVQGTSASSYSSPATATPTHQSGNAGSSQPHSKQFSCPFCEKSYSWKQTLKQHVSMYHRNKVHTDEFWKYELTKHRRAVVDSKTNEDMWKKQLGKHGSEQKPENNNEMWLEQIQQTASPSKSSISAEMKLLALQSLQSSLKLMKMQEEGASGSVPGEGPSKIDDVSPPSQQQTPPQDAGYLSLLAHISSAQRRVVEKEDRSESPSLPEEPAAKRTQMWLAQLGRYRQKSVQYEIEKNHDELWEEQIAKIKQNPVKSPLEPVEITIDDDEEENELEDEEARPEEDFRLGREEEAKIKEEQQEPEIGGPSPPIHRPCKMVPLMSALEVTAAHQEDDAVEQISSDGSVLKSLLLDRFGRKRPSMDPSPVPPKAPNPLSPQDESTDILRRRLLGLKEENEEEHSQEQQKSLVVLDIDVENNNRSSSSGINYPAEDPRSRSSRKEDEDNNNHLCPTTFQESSPPKEDSREEKVDVPQAKPQRKDSTYARTSVLKHLLHRYTESHNMD